MNSIRSIGTISYSLLYLNSRIGCSGLNYLYSGISVIDKWLPGNTKKWTLVHSWTARVRLVHPWADCSRANKLHPRHTRHTWHTLGTLDTLERHERHQSHETLISYTNNSEWTRVYRHETLEIRTLDTPEAHSAHSSHTWHTIKDTSPMRHSTLESTHNLLWMNSSLWTLDTWDTRDSDPRHFRGTLQVGTLDTLSTHSGSRDSKDTSTMEH